MDNSSINGKNLIFTIKPSKKSALILFKSLGTTIRTFFLLNIFGFSILAKIFLSDTSFLGIIVLEFIFFLVWWFIAFLISRMQLNAIDYKFYDDSIEYVDGFLVKSKKKILYSRITDITQGQTILERIFGLGTIVVETAGNSSMLRMNYLENTEELFDKINHLVKEGSK